jgi:hypothetical protein
MNRITAALLACAALTTAGCASSGTDFANTAVTGFRCQVLSSQTYTVSVHQDRTVARNTALQACERDTPHGQACVLQICLRVRVPMITDP